MVPEIRSAAGVAFATLGLLATPTLAHEEQTVHLSAHVPVYCSVQFMPSVGSPENGLVTLGQSFELCNAPRGYRIILQHPAGLADAALISDATRIPLSASGETVLVDSDHASLHVRQLALDLGANPTQIGNLGLRIEVNY
ncbi:MAG: hypothetical protein EOP58_13090 [Sphingomonadales bacterium]|nr:MAG: hypothetical protein EOP58_13090 [Sphingomonadales bacterium]